MSAWVLVDAAALVVRSEALVGVSLVASAAARVAEPALLTRAMEPALTWPEALIAGAHRARRPGGGPAVVSRPRPYAALVAVLVVVASTSAVVLGGDRTAIGVLLAIGAVTVSAAAVLRLGGLRTEVRGTTAARRSPHLVGLAISAEMAVLIAITTAVVSVATASDATALIPFEVATIVIAARLVHVLGASWKAGVALASFPLVLLVGATGLPVDVGLAGVVLWWAGWLIGGAVLLMLARRPVPAPDSDSALARDGARLAHRAAFALLGLAPEPSRGLVRRRVFDSMFSVSADPWDYTAAYERRKQQHLVASLRGRYKTIVEVGCADGHNVEALARACPAAIVLGTDVSARALDVARRRTRGFGNAHVVPPDEVAARLANAEQPHCVVLAEVLYYLVTARAIRDALGSLAATPGEQRDFLMLHGAADGRALHRRAARALGLDILHEQTVNDPVRPFVITLARTRSVGRS